VNEADGPKPDGGWRRLLIGCRYFLYDRDSKFSAGFCEILRTSGIQPLALPPRSPNLNAHLETWNRSIEEECLAKLILFGEPALRHALTHYVQRYHEERNHQGKDNLILFPAAADRIGRAAGKIQTRERLGGMLKFYHREAV
jgi:putative transposase